MRQRPTPHRFPLACIYHRSVYKLLGARSEKERQQWQVNWWEQ
jgi:hypothetical protein